MLVRLARALVLFAALIVPSLAPSAHASPPTGRVARLDPYLRRAVDLARGLRTPSTRTRSLVLLRELDQTVAIDAGARTPSAVVRVAGDPTSRALAAIGAHVVSPGVAAQLVRVPLVALPRLAALPGVRFVESLARMRPRLDISVALTGAEALHAADPTVTGAGVVYGSIDSGIDVRHPTFRNLDGTTRVEAFWDACDMSGDPPPGFEGFGGTLYTREDIDAELDGDDRFPHEDSEGHGTLTAGIGAGSGNDGELVGMAPGASIVVVAIFGDDNGCDNPNVANEFGGASSVVSEAARFIEAQAAGRPFVVNMSIGDHVGPHDGTSLLDQDLGAIATAGAGRALVAAAGNEAAGGVHAGMFLPASGDIYGLDAIGQFGYDGAVEIWYPGDADVEIRVRQREACGEAVETGDELLTDGYFIDNARDGADARNGDRVAMVEVYGDLVPAGDADACAAACEHFIQACDGQDPFGEAGACFDRCLAAWDVTRVDCVATFESEWGPQGDCNGTFFRCLPVEFTVEMRATGGRETRVDVYGAGFATTLDAPGPDMTVGEPASSHGIIAAAAFVHRAHMRGGLDAQGELGALTDYSSHGPMRDGRDKPEIAAPAELVTSAFSQWSEPFGVIVSGDGFWMTTSGGTSSASPHVAGAIALLLEQYPALELEGIHEALARGAGVDGDTGTPPDDGWGWGKLRVDQALTALETPLTDADGDGFGASSGGGIDCDDASADVGPRAAEVAGNALDDDCDGEVDEPLPEAGFFERADPLCADELEPDAGPDGGVIEPDSGAPEIDAGTDAATGEPDAGPSGGGPAGGACSCRAAGTRAGDGGWVTMLTLVGLLLTTARIRSRKRPHS